MVLIEYNESLQEKDLLFKCSVMTKKGEQIRAIH